MMGPTPLSALRCPQNKVAPIYVASQNGHAAAVDRLVAARADVNTAQRVRPRTGRRYCDARRRRVRRRRAAAGNPCGWGLGMRTDRRAGRIDVLGDGGGMMHLRVG